MRIGSKSGFSLVEVMIIFTVMAVVVAASIPIVSKKGYTPITGGLSKGMYVCYPNPDGGGFIEVTYKRGREKSRNTVMNCSLNKLPSNISSFEVTLIGAGAGGYDSGSVDNVKSSFESPVTYSTRTGEFDNLKIGKNGTTDEDKQAIIDLLKNGELLWKFFTTKNIPTINGTVSGYDTVQVTVPAGKGGKGGTTAGCLNSWLPEDNSCNINESSSYRYVSKSDSSDTPSQCKSPYKPGSSGVAETPGYTISETFINTINANTSLTPKQRYEAYLEGCEKGSYNGINFWVSGFDPKTAKKKDICLGYGSTIKQYGKDIDLTTMQPKYIGACSQQFASEGEDPTVYYYKQDAKIADLASNKPKSGSYIDILKNISRIVDKGYCNNDDCTKADSFVSLKQSGNSWRYEPISDSSTQWYKNLPSQFIGESCTKDGYNTTENGTVKYCDYILLSKGHDSFVYSSTDSSGKPLSVTYSKGKKQLADEAAGKTTFEPIEGSKALIYTAGSGHSPSNKVAIKMWNDNGQPAYFMPNEKIAGADGGTIRCSLNSESLMTCNKVKIDKESGKIIEIANIPKNNSLSNSSSDSEYLTEWTPSSYPGLEIQRDFYERLYRLGKGGNNGNVVVRTGVNAQALKGNCSMQVGRGGVAYKTKNVANRNGGDTVLTCKNPDNNSIAFSASALGGTSNSELGSERYTINLNENENEDIYIPNKHNTQYDQPESLKRLETYAGKNFINFGKGGDGLGFEDKCIKPEDLSKNFSMTLFKEDFYGNVRDKIQVGSRKSGKNGLYFGEYLVGTDGDSSTCLDNTEAKYHTKTDYYNLVPAQNGIDGAIIIRW